MQNDAKLGLLVGVLGVIVAATIPVKSPASLKSGSDAASLKSSSKGDGKSAAPKQTDGRVNDVAAPAIVPGEPGTTAAARTKKDTEATITARSPRDAEER